MYINLFPSGYVNIKDYKPFYKNYTILTLPYKVIENKKERTDMNIAIVYDKYSEKTLNPIAQKLSNQNINGTASIILIQKNSNGDTTVKPFSEFGVRQVIKSICADKRFSDETLKNQVIKPFRSARAVMQSKINQQVAYCCR